MSPDLDRPGFIVARTTGWFGQASRLCRNRRNGPWVLQPRGTAARLWTTAYDAQLFFANAENFLRRALAAVDATPEPVRWFLLNAEANVEVDITAIDALERLREALEHRGITFAMARVKQDLADELERAGFLARVGADRVFPTLPTAVAAYNDQASPDDSSRRAAGSARKGLAPAASGPARSQNTTPPR